MSNMEGKYGKYEKYRPLIESIDLFQGIDFPHALKIVSMGITSRPHRGEKIFSKGDLGTEMYVILKGKVEIVDSDVVGDRIIAVLGPGETFGEMALFGASKRSATAVVAEESTILALSEERVQKLLTKNVAIKLLFNIIRTLSARLRLTNSELMRQTKTRTMPRVDGI